MFSEPPRRNSSKPENKMHSNQDYSNMKEWKTINQEMEMISTQFSNTCKKRIRKKIRNYHSLPPNRNSTNLQRKRS